VWVVTLQEFLCGTGFNGAATRFCQGNASAAKEAAHVFSASDIFIAAGV
jgi:hypothetical protein